MDSPPVGTTVHAMRAGVNGLNRGERLAIEKILEDPAAAVSLSAAELGEAAGVSSATVIRACQSLGFKGFQHVRMLVTRDVGATAAQATPGECGGIRGSVIVHLDRLITAARRDIETADDGLFELITARFRSAGKILLVGGGSSKSALDALQLDLTLLGLPVDYPSDSVIQLLRASMLTSNDVCVAISQSGATHSTLQAAREATKTGCFVLPVTADRGSPLAKSFPDPLVLGLRPTSAPHSGAGSAFLQGQVLAWLGGEAVAGTERGKAARARIQEAVYTSVVTDWISPPPMGERS